MFTKKQVHQLRRVIYKSRVSMMFNDYVRTVLEREPNANDQWQYENWVRFRLFTSAFLRIPEEQLITILTEGAKRVRVQVPSENHSRDHATPA